MTNDLSNMMRKVLGKTSQNTSSANAIVFTLDSKNSNRAIGQDKTTIVSLEYGILPTNSYVNYISASSRISLCFDNHHNGSCTVFIAENQKLSEKMIRNLMAALKVIGFKDISFDMFGGS